jgi:hypothetical protein
MLDKYIENYAIMPSMEVMGFKDRNFGGVSQHKGVPKTIFKQGEVYRMISVQYV